MQSFKASGKPETIAKTSCLVLTSHVIKSPPKPPTAGRWFRRMERRAEGYGEMRHPFPRWAYPIFPFILGAHYFNVTYAII
jgi:hypothetical protein